MSRTGRGILAGAAALVLLVGGAPAVAGAAGTGVASLAPLQIRPDGGLSAQFGYAPPYTRNVPAFDAANRPYIRSRSADPHQTSFVHTLAGGTWTRLSLVRSLRAQYPDFVQTEKGAAPTSRIVFDTGDRAYTLLRIRLRDGSRRNVLLWSVDHCRTWRVAPLPDGAVTCESWVGHNTIDGPPLLLVSRVTSAVDTHTGKLQRTLWAAQPRLVGDTVEVPALTLVSSYSVGLGDAASTASPVVTHGPLSEIVWTETTARPGRGSPVYVATYDRSTGMLGPKVLVARTTPANDGHAQPGIVIDSQGYLHVIAGAHGREFQYVRSLLPGSAYAGWWPPEPTATTGYVTLGRTITEEARQTYLAFVCGPDDRLHIIYRQWRRNVDDVFDGAVYGALTYQRRDPLVGWEPPQVVVVPPYADYSVFGQALGMDHEGRLYVSLSCLSGPEGAARRVALASWRQAGSDGPEPPLYLRRMVLVSDDAGTTWRFAATQDFAAGIAR
jgi:hypothetical protein